MEVVSLWDKTLQLIKGDIGTTSYISLFKSIVPLKIQMNDLYLLVPNEFNKGMLEDRYLSILQDTLKQVSLKE